MAKIDPIIAVKDVEGSSAWYQRLFGWRSMHGGAEFDILVDEVGEVMLCLHQWGAHEHPTMQNPQLTPGNGLILYFRTPAMESIREMARQMGLSVEEEVHLNPNSTKLEFSLCDPDGYYLTITAYHEYKG
ncbi:MAG: glyoxalase [Bacteroidia bacterium]|nr:glyoxalase [Bacteroidia bacterium]